jgi:hypothetical protein
MPMITTPIRRGLCCAMLFACCGVAAAAMAPGAPVSNDRVAVSYRNPAGFTEMDRDFGARRDWLDELSRYVARRAAVAVPEGRHLSVTITDVQRAGMIEPWHRAGTDLRVVRNTTPPRIDLNFQLVDANGAVLKEGSRQLRDIMFLTRHTRYTRHPLAYENNLIDVWVLHEFGGSAR